MLDLNTLVAPGSGFQLTNAFNINDRGEILAKADAVGVTPIDDADLGHLVLLIPCDENHGDSAGCEEGGEDAVSQTSPAIRDASNRALAPRIPRGYRYHITGAQPRPAN